MTAYLAARRAEALAILADPTTRPSLRETAWRFLSQHRRAA